MDKERPRFEIRADRESASRRLHYRETNHPVSGECRICQLDSHTEEPAQVPTDTQQDDEAFAAARLTEAIENQLESGEPAFTQAVLNYLTLTGHSREESLELMALALANEIRALMKEERGFDLIRYEQLLRALPQLPDE